MKSLVGLLIAAASLLSGCVVYDPYQNGEHRRDRDGIPDHRDSRPNNPNRY